ncbi:polymorphic toxin-type HINT domain-containing protein [Streptomyces sp. NPDC056909]|uniref:polymorphic toxin-type HINT domain-containing protein n=1 Tax=Streptomyces sp. NPDC056909 TaxID=3345963 RepID=UPI003699593F
MNVRLSRRIRVVRRRVALASATVMVATLLQAVAAAPVAIAEGTGRPDLPRAEKPVPGATAGRAEPRTLMKGPRTPQAEPDADWPKAASAVVELPTGAEAAPVKVQGVPLSLESPKTHTKDAARGTVRAGVLDRDAAERTGVNGPLFTLRSSSAQGGDPGRVRAELDYSSFAEAFGGGYASRLTLVELPACAVTTPEKERCRSAEPVPTVNDTEKRTLTADAVSVGAGAPTVLAAVAEASSGSGDYKATPLSPSATWSTSLNTGDFSWSYDMPAPDVPGGLTPSVGLSYSSGSVDGRTGGTNNQSSWAGDGFDLWPGFIERRYKTCADDDAENADGDTPGDLCWGYDNAFISFNGKGGELVPNGTNSFKLKDDDGTKVERVYGTTGDVRSNDARDDEYWKITTPDGFQYFFGYNRLPGWAAGKETTDSTWTVPVFGDDSGEPCHASTFAASWCQQGWRWNLDYTVDPHGNAIAYYYDKESNFYGRNLKAEDDTPYTRGGYLDRIEYGLDSSAMYAAKALAKVDFTSGERCVPDAQTDCDSIADDAFYWYDTPWDLNCAAGTDCDEGRLSPAFFTRNRLTSVVTQVLRSNAYQNVDSWKLTHRWGMADTDYQLLLDSVQRTGHTATPAITLPKTTFSYTQLANRLDKTGDGYAPFIKDRLSTIADEAGGQTDVGYSDPACDWDALPTPQTNTTRCFPQYIGGTTTDDPERQWFNKYVVTSVTATDRTGGSPDRVTMYEYLGGAAWHYDDDDGLTKEEFKTWSQWRGYGRVQVKTGGQGGAAAMKSQADTYFMRGMDGDRASPSGGTKSVGIALGTDEGDPLTDHESAAGFTYKAVSYSGPGGKVLGKTVNRPWHHETAKKVRDWGTVSANFTGTKSTKSWNSLDDGAGTRWRTTESDTEFDIVAGRVTEIDDFGDSSTSADDKCTRTTYATNTAGILTLPSRVVAIAQRCGLPETSPVVISDVRNAYDGGGYGTVPTKGDTTATALLKSQDATTRTYAESGATYDAYGRKLTSTDLTANVTVKDGVLTRTARSDGRTTTTAYTPTTGFPTSAKVTSPPTTPGDSATAQTFTTTREPLRGVPLTQTDTNGKVTNFAYDALGRSTKVWLADRLTGQTPTYEYTYTVADGQPIAVGTRTLGNNGVQSTSYTLYDGFLRPRQTQVPGPGGGRLLADTFYDERGLTEKEFATYYATGKPSTGLFEPAAALGVETQNRYAYDGLGRQVEARRIGGNGDGGDVLGVTKTIYGGDRTTVIPPDGGTAATTLTDARGQTTELRQHHQRTADSAYDTTKYAHTPRGELSTVTDPAGNEWKYTYDLLGQVTETKDPDKGTIDQHYDDRGLLTSVVDDRGTTLAYVYDGVGRKTELRSGSATGTLRAKWVYDTVSGAKGQLAESTRYSGGQAYTSKVVTYDRLYRATLTSVTIPPTEGALQGTYQSTTSYDAAGTVHGVGYPKAGALPATTVSFTYEDETLRPIALAEQQGVDATVSYTLTGKPTQYELSNDDGKKLWATNFYEWGTQRLANARVDRQDVPGVDQSSTFRYDEAGNALSVSDVSRSGTDTQCFDYDYLRRLTEAWTQPTTVCSEAPSGGVLGGPAPYWQSYTYDKVGNRLTEVEHDVSGDASKDITHSYDYPDAGADAVRPHSLTSVTTTGPGIETLGSYTYDEIGNTDTRVLGSGTSQDLDWDAEGHLAKVTEPVEGGSPKVTEYLYDADGNRLIARTPTESTLYLGSTEVTVAKGATTAKATRYFDLGGGHQAVQEDNGTVSFTLADHHGTAQLAVNPATQAMSQRRTLPFGGLRGTQPASWPGTKGFVGGTNDTSTDLTHLGAREYDPSTGRFLSVDPVMDLTDPQQIHGYTYGNNNPLTFSDPSGLFCDGCSANNPDTVWTPDNGPGCTTQNCYDDDGKVIYPVGGGGGKPKPDSDTPARTVDVTQDENGQILIEGQALPPAITLQAMYPLVENDERLGEWAQDMCSADQGTAFCKAAEAMGLVTLGQSPFDKLVTAVVISLVAPDIDSWKSCLGGESWSSCGNAALDLPLARVLKGAKVLRACNSFVPGTEVLMADGSTKPIEDVENGDKVIATDPRTGKTAVKTVTAEITGEGLKRLVTITLDVDGDRTTVTATDGHPFWLPELGEWVDATDLEPGQWLRTSAGSRIQITAIARRAQQTTVHNLTIADTHTYYVLAGQTPVLVHNSNCDPRFSVDSKGNATDLANPGGRVGVPKLEGGTLQEVGGRVWGSGDPSHLVGTRSPTELRGLASRGDAEKLQDFYQSAALAGKGGKTAPARVKLTQEIIDAWR